MPDRHSGRTARGAADPGTPADALPDAAAVHAFLRAHPGWLAQQPELYAVLDPPRRWHGEPVADHMAAMLARARADVAAGTADRRAADGFSQRVQGAVLALMRAPDPAWCVTHELSVLLQLDGARLLAEGPQPGVGRLPHGAVATLLGRRLSLVRDAVLDPALHGEAAALARREALVRVALPGRAGLLVLACRDGQALAGASNATLGFLAHAVAAAFEAR